MKGLLASPARTSLLLSGLGLLGARTQNQADKYFNLGAQGLLNHAQGVQDQKKLEEQRAYDQPLRDAQIAALNARANPGGKRQIIKGADGYQYYVDTGERVLPNVQAGSQQEFSIQELADGRKYYVPKAPGTAPTLVNPELSTTEPQLSSEDIFKNEAGLRKEYNDQSKEFIKQTSAYQRVVSSAQDPSAAGDLALIFNYMKVLDPGSTVREGEFATAQNSGGIDSRVRSLYNSIINGQRLNHKQRSDFVDRAGRLYQGAQGLQAGVDDRYRALAESYQASPDNILFSPGVEIYQYPQELLTQDPVEPRPETKVVNGVTYTLIDGEWYAD